MEQTTYYLYHKISPLGLNYLGITQRNPYKYTGSGKYWKKHLKKHKFGYQDIKTVILFETTNLNELQKQSIYFSRKYDVVKSDKWANLTPETGDNSMLGYNHTEESKIKMSESRKGMFIGDKNPMFGKSVSNHTREKISKANTGQKRSKETKEKIREKAIGRNPSLETREKISKSNEGKKSFFKGRNHTLESKKIMSQIHSGKHTGRNNNNYNSTPILQLDKQENIIKEWQDLLSLKEAGFNKKQISKACRGLLKSSSGFIWKFKTNNNLT